MTHNGNTCSQLLLGDRVVAVHDVREEIHADAEVVEAGLAEREELVAAVLREPAGGGAGEDSVSACSKVRASARKKLVTAAPQSK